MLDNQQLEAAIEATTAPKVTKEYMETRIASREFIRIGATVTICHLTLDNGFSVRGESACASPANYNQEIGERIAFDNAFDKLWQLFGFLLVENIFMQSIENQAKAPA